jgi:hypothetical protein
MDSHLLPEFTALNALAAVGIALVFIALSSLLKEPDRQQLMAVILGGAGAAYLNSGLGGWEFAFCALLTFIAYKGLRQYYFIGIGWLLHTVWDVLHHLYASPIVSFSPSSSAGCALCDALLALWFFLGAPSVYDWFRRRKTVRLNAE